MKQMQERTVATSATMVNFDFKLPLGYYINSIQIQTNPSCIIPYAIYIIAEYYIDSNDVVPEILDNWWIRGTTGYYAPETKVLNRQVDYENNKLRVKVLNQSAAEYEVMVIVSYSPNPTHQTNDYRSEEHRGIWTLNAMWEAIGVGVINVTITPAPGSWFDLMSCKLTAGFSAAEDVVVTIKENSTTPLILQTLARVNTTTGTIEFPSQSTLSSAVATTANALGASKEIVRICYPNSLVFDVSSCAATDDILVLMQCQLKDVIPTITFAANSQVQAGYAATAYSRVI